MNRGQRPLAPALLPVARMVRSVLTALLLASVLVTAPGAGAETIAAECPAYAVRLERARASLVGGDHTGALAALREAQRELAECIRRESDNAGAPVLLAAASPW